VGDPTLDQLHWNQLRKQFLLEEKAANYKEVVKHQLGLHSTDYWTPYLSTWARIGDFDAKDMFESLDSGRDLVRTHAFRTTVHVMHIENLSTIINATGPSLFRAYRTDKYRKVDILSDREIEKMLTSVKMALKEKPLTTSDLKKVLPDVGDYVRSALIMLMARGEVVRAKAPHARSNLTSYALLENWVDGFRLEIIDEEEALSDLSWMHIERFGPVSIDDIAWWLRLSKTAVKNIIAKHEENIVKVEIETGEGFMENSDYQVASTLERPKEDLVWFIPYEDHFLKAIINRSRFIEDDIQPMLFPSFRTHFWPSNPDAPKVEPSKGLRATGEVRPSIWLNGKVVGRWEMDDEEDQKKIVTSVYKKVTKKQLSQIEQVRSELDEFVNRRLVPISN